MSHDGKSRRSVLLGGAALSVGILSTSRGVFAQEVLADFQDEVQFGDPTVEAMREAQLLVVNQKPIDDSFRQVAFGFRKPAKAVSDLTMEIAASYVNKNQVANPEMVEQFFAIFQMPARGSDGRFYPFCAAGLSLCAAAAYCRASPNTIKLPKNPVATLIEALSDVNKLFFRPNPLCWVMRQDAIKRGAWVDRAAEPNVKALRGWHVVYDWNGDGRADHIGLVERHTGDQLSTIEFNTSLGTGGNQTRGGHVARRTRDTSRVMGYIRTY